MDIFNAPTRESCTVRRERTNTPLQALVTLNDPQFVEAARRLAERALQEAHGHFDRQLDYMTLRLLSRTLQPAEREVATRAYQDYRDYYASHPEGRREAGIGWRNEAGGRSGGSGFRCTNHGGEPDHESGRSAEQVRFAPSLRRL
jgi:hypothetical protein